MSMKNIAEVLRDQTWSVRISGGTSLTELHNVKMYELLDLKGGVYHKFTLEDGSLLYLNDFGIRSIHVTKEGSPVRAV